MTIKSKLRKTIGTGLLALAGCGPAEARNFSQENAEVVSHDIPTSGRVNMVDRALSLVNDSTINEDGSITYTGMLRYCINPISPQDPDKHPNYRDPEHWCAKRYGEVTVKGDEK